MHRFVNLLLLSSCFILLQPSLANDPNPTSATSNKVKPLLPITPWSYPDYRKYQFKSVKKCQEYADATVEVKWVKPVSASRPIPIPIGCRRMNRLVMGGTSVQPNEYPHMAAIGWMHDGQKIDYYCGGALISEQWVLTAAHCTNGPLGRPAVVRLGTDRLSDNTTGQLIKIENIMTHPTYHPPAMYADLALIKLEKKVVFGPTIKPACLHFDFGEAPEKGWITGWGRTGSSDQTSDVLLKAQLDIIDNVRCAMIYNYTIAVPDGVVPSMVCAGDATDGWKKDTCRGDSGGPLQSPHPNGCLQQVIGVTSFGQPCGTTGFPGVYTRVSHYIDWIESIVWP